MSVSILSRKESQARSLKIFSELQPKSIFTYQDEAGIHLCLVKIRISDEAIIIVKISDSGNIDALVESKNSLISDEVYVYDESHCLNLLDFAKRNPTKQERQKRKLLNELENFYSENMDAIWKNPNRAFDEDNVMLYFDANNNVVVKFVNLRNIESWLDKDGLNTFIVKSITDAW